MQLKTNETGNVSWRVDKQTRDTQIIPLDHLYPKVEGVMCFRDVVKEVVNPFYGIEVDSSEVPQCLSYEIGGHYKPHIDVTEGIWVAPTGEKIWKKSTDRDISLYSS